MKTQLQLQGKNGIYTGPLDCAKKIVVDKGILALYKGLSTLVIGTFAKAAIRFYSYHQYAQLIFPVGEAPKSYHMMLAGLAAGMTEAVIAVAPTETVKTKLIHDMNRPQPQYRGLIDGTRAIIKSEGIAGIYRGVFPTMLRQGANSAIRFTVFSKAQTFWAEDSSLNKTARSFINGGIAGTAATLLTMPIDVVKTRMQGMNASQYRNVVHCAVEVFKHEGIVAFWKGTTPRLSRVVFSSSIVFGLQDAIMQLWQK